MKHLVIHPRPLSLFALLALALASSTAALVRPTLAASSSSNNTAIVFPGPDNSGPALAPSYPSQITVGGLDGSITRLTVTLTGISYEFWDNLDIMLVGPDGTHVMLMSDVGGSTNSTSSPISLTFDDGAASALPDSNTTAIATGSYKPTNFQTTSDSFPAPAPSISSFNTSLGAFKLKSPNGVWSLYAMEDDTGTTGTIASWSLTFQTADLVASIGAAPSVNAGSTLTYTVTVNNLGTEAVANPTVSIPLPDRTTFSSVSLVAPTTNWTCQDSVGGQPISCTIGSFPSGGAATFSVSVVADKDLASGATINRSASITSSVQEANTTNNSAAGSTSVTTLADLAVTSVTSPARVNAGAAMSIVANAQNNGPSNAANAVVVLPIPANTSYADIATSAGWTCLERPALPSGSEVACNRGVFVAGTTASFTLTVDVDADLPPSTADPDTEIAARATIDSDTADNTAANDTAADATIVDTQTDLAVTVSDSPDPVSASAELTYEIVVTNNGPSNAAGASLASAVQLGTAFVSLASPDGWTCGTKPAVGGRGAISCTNPSFGVTSATFTLKVRVLSGAAEGETLSLTASAASTTSDSDGTNNSATETTGVTVASDLSVTIDGVGPKVLPSSTIAYNINVNNSGPEAAESVSLTTAVPANTTFVSIAAPAGWTCGTKPAAGGTGPIVCANPGLAVKTDTLVLTVQVGNQPNGTPIGLTAEVATAANTDKKLTNNAFTLPSVVSNEAELGVAVSGPQSDARPGANVTYTITVGNAGPDSAKDAQLSIPAVANTTFVSLAAPQGWSCAPPAVGAKGAIICTSPSLGQATAIFTMVVKADEVTANTTIVVSAAATASSADLTQGNNTASVTTPLIYRYLTLLPLVTK